MMFIVTLRFDIQIGICPVGKGFKKVEKHFGWHFTNQFTLEFGFPHQPRTPAKVNGDLSKAIVRFDESIEAQPAYLGTKVLKAELYATKMQDPVLFEQLLNEVVAADASALPELGPENRAEQDKAKKLLANKSDFFAN